jgi:hypothetical protein
MSGVVANFLRWIPKEEQIKRQLALDAALFSRPLFALPDKVSHVQGIVQILSAYEQTDQEQYREIVRFLRKISQEQFIQESNTSIQWLVKQLLL